jgi:uncharacterized protein with HEPN domain
VNELCAISENLNVKEVSPMRTRYPELFESASSLRGMRNILVHRYGLPGPGVDWEIVWAALDSHLESDLLPKLDEAIGKEEEEENEEEEE